MHDYTLLSKKSKLNTLILTFKHKNVLITYLHNIFHGPFILAKLSLMASTDI